MFVRIHFDAASFVSYYSYHDVDVYVALEENIASPPELGAVLNRIYEFRS